MTFRFLRIRSGSFCVKAGLSLILVLSHCMLVAQRSRIDSVYSKLPADKTDTSLVKRLLTLSEAHLSVDIDSSVYFTQEAIRKNSAIKFKRGEALAYFLLGKALSDNGSQDSALTCFQKAIKIFPEHEYGNIGDAHNERGGVFFRQGHLDSAKMEFEQLLSYKILVRDFLAIASAYNNLGVVCRNMSDYKCALNNYFKSLKIRERKNDQKGISQSYTNIAVIYGNLDQHEKSLEYDRKSLQIKEKLNDRPGIAKSYNNIASTFAAMGQYDSAITYNNKAIEGSPYPNERHNEHRCEQGWC